MPRQTVELNLAEFHVKEIWECEWDKMVKDDPCIKAFLNGFDLVPPLNPRYAFFGGIKQESSGWPRWCSSDEQKQQYIEHYEARKGFLLDYDQVVKNPGGKDTAKLMLNSFWGKFGERQNKATTITVQEPSHLFSLLTDDTLNISTIRLSNEDVLEVVHSSQDEAADNGSKVNIFIIAFTTCHARLKLYEVLHVLQHQVLYYDTGSVIYRWSPGLPSIPIGDYLVI